MPVKTRLTDVELAAIKFGITGYAFAEKWMFVVEMDWRIRDDYIVSSIGRVVRIKGGRGTRSGTILRLSQNRDGYPTACLTRGGISTTYNVHVLVATAFHGVALEDEFGKFHAHHINGNRADNRASNLVWMSSREHAAEWWHKRMSG
jgi:hypothetical protein